MGNRNNNTENKIGKTKKTIKQEAKTTLSHTKIYMVLNESIDIRQIQIEEWERKNGLKVKIIKK